MHSDLAGVFLPAQDGAVDVVRIQVHEIAATPQALTGDQCGAGAAAQVRHQAAPGR